MSGVKYIAASDKDLPSGFSAKKTGISLLLTVITVFLLLLAAAFVLTYTSAQMSSVSAVSRLILFAGAAFAGFFSGAGGKKSGWLLGLLAGIIYMSAVTAVGMFIRDEYTFSWLTAVNILLGAVLGAVGGIVGINVSKTKKYKRKSKNTERKKQK